MKTIRVMALVAVIVLLAAALLRTSGVIGSAKQAALPVRWSLVTLMGASSEALKALDIVRMNLVCAEGLPGSETLDVNRSMAKLDEMAARVRTETERHYYRFQRNPAEFENSEGYFRMILLAVVLAEDFRVQYNPKKIGNAADAWLGDGFFADSRDVFLHGLTGPKSRGTCSSLPVLQVAIGRRLGYPLKLVTTKGHLFVRWEDARERFNIEAAGNGVNRFSDDYYRHWPLEVSEEEIHAESYLKSLSPAEELAVFLSIRGMCLAEAGRFGEAADAFQAAAKSSPNCRSYATMRDEFTRRARGSLAGVSRGASAPMAE